MNINKNNLSFLAINHKKALAIAKAFYFYKTLKLIMRLAL